MPKLKKLAKPKEEPKKEEQPKRTKVKLPKAKKYEDLPEIPDYERPELEVYEESEFDPSKATKAVERPTQQSEKPVESMAETIESKKNGLPKVSDCFSYVLFMNNLVTGLFSWILRAPNM